MTATGQMPRASASARRGSFAIAMAALMCLTGCASSGFGAMTASVASTSSSLFGSKDRGQARQVSMFVVSTRRNDRRVADAVSDGGVHHSLVSISVPPGHSPGAIETPSFGKADSRRHFVMTGGRALSPDRFSTEIANHLSGRVGTDRDILLHIHGFNTSLESARFRLAQIVTDAHFGGVPVLFTWPSESNLLSYVSDKERATASRDALGELMRNLAAVPGVGRVHIVAHSMGAWLAMEALRENAIAGEPSLGGKLGEVMLAAPDIDLGVFRQQMARLGSAAKVSVFVSSTDRALGISSRIAGDRPRLGSMNPTNPKDRAALESLGVNVYDLSSINDGFIGHGAYADSPDIIRSIGIRLAAPEDVPTVAAAEPPVETAPLPGVVPPPEQVGSGTPIPQGAN